ncbi:MAG TPA: malonyl-ACP O-methyltransferase BioC [Methylophilaceae bacterium]|jgi:malonyl-CoA O-methyltransferase
MNDIYRIDKARVRTSFDRAAESYDSAAILQAEVRERMLSRLDFVKIAPRTILDAGCGTGRASHALAKRFADSRIISLDIAMGMLKKTQTARGGFERFKRLLGISQQTALCADIENLPLANGSLGLVWSNLAIQWCNDLDQVFSEAHRVLQPEGLVMFSSFGPDTLKELRQATSTDPEHVHVSRFIDMHDIGDALVRAGFTAPVLDVEHFVLTYDDVISVMRDLKTIGAHNAAEGRHRGLLGKGFLQKLIQDYERFRKDGKLPATFEVVYGHAWKPQPKFQSEDGSIPITLHKRSR